MYGFINQALQEFVIRESSFETWEEILWVFFRLILCCICHFKAIAKSEFCQSTGDFIMPVCALYLHFRKKANVDLGETNEFMQRRIYDDHNTADLLRVASETLGKIYSTC